MSLFKNIFGKKDSPSRQDMHDYANDKLSDKKSRAMEEAMADNPLLSDAMDGFKEFGSQEIDNVPDFDTFYQKKAPKFKTATIRPMINRMAAAVLMLLVASAIYLYWSESSSERIFADNFSEFKDPLISDSRNTESTEKWHEYKEEAIALLRAKDYSKSIIYWEKYEALGNQEAQTLFYLGFAHMKNENPDKAIEYLSAIAGTASEYQNEAKWYLALAQLKIKDDDGAKSTLQDLKENGDNFYSGKAKSILEQL